MFRFLLSNNHLPNILVEGIIKDTVQKGEIVCMKVNDIIHGFRLLKQDYVKECASETFEFIHVKSGARLLYLKNDDNNKVFSIAFRTPPTDNTGVPHIMEHSTLCGSRKFPLKEPFVELVKGSLNTFLNAMTYPDKTVYPVASCNDKDFHNLMDVYLDAVFHPAIYTKPDILMQEGWHYEIEKKDDPLTYSGVVYGEMKGALSSPEDLLYNEIMRGLYPDTAYSWESGGNPAAIPDLTYESFLDFHRKFYSPANSYIYLYGDMNIEEQLAFIDAEYLQDFDLVEVDSSIREQKAFSSMKFVEKPYPIGSDESAKEKTFLCYSVIAGNVNDIELQMAISILNTVLMQTPASPLRKALIDAELGKDVSGTYERSLCQPFWSVEVTGSEADRMNQFIEVLRTTMQKLADEGIDKTIIEASLNHMEFQFRESDFGAAPKGLIYNISALESWLYDGDPLITLRYEEAFASLREKISTGYFEEVLRKYLLDNPFAVAVTLKPDNEMAARNDKALADKLAAIKASMTDQELEKIIADTARLKKNQQTPDSPEALATIPLLEISDINPEPVRIPMEEREIDGIKVVFSDVDTKGIAYVDLGFAADVVPQELNPYLFLLVDLIGLVNTSSSTYEELANRINMNTGGVSVNGTTYEQRNTKSGYLPMVHVTGKAFMGKLPIMIDLMREIITDSSFADKKRLKELILQARAEKEADMLQASVSVAQTRLKSYFSESGAYSEQGGLSLYSLLKELSDNFDDNFDGLRDNLTKVMKLVFGAKGLVLGVTMRSEEYPKYEQEIKQLIAVLRENTVAEKAEKQNYSFDIATNQEALLSASMVQYVAKGANIRDLGYDVPGTIRIMETILRYEYFWTKIRVQGGAYGSMTRIGYDGNLVFVSYRDPKLKETIETFDKTADYLAGFQASSREMTKYIIGTISGLDTPLTPKMVGPRAMGCYLRGDTYEDRKKKRQEILNATPESIQSLAPAIRDAMAENNLCVFGNETVLKDNQEIFKTLTRVMD